jgi:hypothetical protein
MRYARLLLLLLVLSPLCGCSEDSPDADAGNRASSGTTAGGAATQQTDDSARATGGVLDEPATAPAQR